jgi:hypothetical protein
VVVVGILAAALVAAAAQEMQAPRLSYIHPDWDAVATDLSSIAPPTAAPSRAPSIADLNRATADLFPHIAASPVPVLLPFDAAGFLNDRAAGITKRADDYFSGFHLSPFFLPGPAGYDAMFTAQASEMPELGITFSGRIDVFVSGFALLYDLPEPVGMVERPVKEFGADLPGIRHLYLENYARNTFERYGVPYVVSILCFDGSSRLLARSPSAFSGRCESPAARPRRHPMRVSPTPSSGRRPCPRISRFMVRATSSPAPAFGAKADAPIIRSIPRCAFRSWTRPPTPIPSRS